MPCPGDPGPRPDWIPAPLVARAVMRYYIYGQNIENVFTFTGNASWNSGSLLDLCVAMSTSWTSNLQDLLTGEVTLVDITATDLEEEDGAQATLAISAVGTSEQNGFETTGNTFVIKFTTARVGRSYRGRMFWPLLANNMVDNGLIVSTAVANQLAVAVGNFFADVDSLANGVHVITSYMNDCAWRTTAVATPVAAYAYTDLALDSQRRRLPGRGT